MTCQPPCDVCVVFDTWHLVSGVLEEKVDIVNGVCHGDAMNAKEDPLLVEALAHLAPSEAKHFEDEEVHLVTNDSLACNAEYAPCAPRLVSDAARTARLHEVGNQLSSASRTFSKSHLSRIAIPPLRCHV
jgi:hypothetical protein